METRIVIYEQITHSDNDFSVKNRKKLLTLGTQRKIKYQFTNLDVGDVIELSIGEEVKHMLIIKINEKINSTEIFVRKIASGGPENKDQLEIQFERSQNV